jgi:hypothetical protein
MKAMLDPSSEHPLLFQATVCQAAWVWPPMSEASVGGKAAAAVGDAHCIPLRFFHCKAYC